MQSLQGNMGSTNRSTDEKIMNMGSVKRARGEIIGSNIPDDVLWDVLIRLPAKTLARMRRQNPDQAYNPENEKYTLGHVNHSIFWKNLAPISAGGGEPPHGSLGWAIDQHFGSMEKLIAKMNAEGAAVQGSGWVWLASTCS
ncbi:Mn-super oxide dismutase I [Artemisia annua]|uniref:superoxide dismutase n=1 Tax=Artemisia annua TaxID=35608 RepID=A0A2U1NCN9_ARTAN|nr:Mn-super oxide dismutase I [Artemisia annua]